ncbi:hypothetical protein JCM10296v2_003385 [Rhodotorula toruloides]
MFYLARQALKRATLHRIRMHAHSKSRSARYASTSSSKSLHMGIHVVRPCAPNQNEPVERDFDQLGAHAQNVARPASAQPARQQQQQQPARAQGQRSAAIEGRLREVAEMQAEQRRCEEEGEDRREGGSS